MLNLTFQEHHLIVLATYFFTLQFQFCHQRISQWNSPQMEILEQSDKWEYVECQRFFVPGPQYPHALLLPAVSSASCLGRESVRAET